METLVREENVALESQEGGEDSGFAICYLETLANVLFFFSLCCYLLNEDN